ncbi:hypothetical protein CN925_15970 [Bacillus sp. AFS055030]|nr:hypothetical protein CN925_15970 [Bacillus sp. AFS055030]
MLKTKEALESFYKEVKDVDIPEFNRVIKTLQNWKIEIFNNFAYNYSNGFLEGCYKRVKLN